MKLLLLKVVLAAIDDDDASAIVLDAARALADSGGASLHVVHVDRARAGLEPSPRAAEGTPTDAVLALLGRANVQLDNARLHVIAGDPPEGGG